ncbi:MAG: hypothetical protein QGI78_08375 [Phycisphaerales bacterium]|nr:hypothetical protein [Phycisphaerales bacterium]
MSAFSFAGMNSDYTKAALRKLSSATQFQRTGEHLANLGALRNLHDPTLKPFFYKLAQHNDWSVQVHAVLGLAELSENGMVDPWLIQQVAPLAREQLVLLALRDQLLTVEDMQSLLEWSLLEPAPTLLLLADLRSKGFEPNAETIEQLINNSDLGLATIASLLSEDSKSITDVTNRFRRATTRERRIALTQTLQLIERYGLPSSTEWLKTLLESPTYRLTDVQMRSTLSTLLRTAPQVGMDFWRNAIPASPSKLEQVRYVLMLMEAGVLLDDSTRSLLQIEADDGLPHTLHLIGSIDTSDSLHQEGFIDSLIDLVNRGHSQSIEWAFRTAQDLPPQLAQQFYTTLSMLPNGDEEITARRRDIAVVAFDALIKTKPEQAWELLRSVEDDSQQQELMLLAMLQHRGDAPLLKEAGAIRRIGVAPPDAMALLLTARGTEALSESDQRLLGLIAASGASIGSSLETQAAWLYLRRMGMTDQALTAATTTP